MGGISLQSMTLTSATTNADGSIIYFGSSSGTFYAFTSTGVMKWFYPAQDAIYSSPTYSAGYVSFGSNDYFVYVLNATTGSLLWRYKTGFVVTGSPTFLSNATSTTMFVGSQDYNLYAFRTTNPGWAVRNFTDTPNTPFLYLDGSANTPSALVGTGKYTLPYCQSMCTSINNCLYVVQDPVAHFCWLKSDYDYFTSTGTQVKGAYFKNYVKWTYATGGPIISTPAVGTVSGVSAVFFGSTDFFIYALSASKGTLLWSVQTGGSVAASALVNPFNLATLYVSSRDMYLYALTTATGSVNWKVNLAASATAGSGAGVYTTFEGLLSVETAYCAVGAPSSFNYVGCFVDNSNSVRTFSTLLFGTTGYQVCFQQARLLGLRYVGFQWWNGPSTGVGQCWAGSSLPQAQSQGVATTCSLVQTSDGSIMWSDSTGNANAVYDIGNSQNVLGVTSMMLGDWTLAMSSTSCTALRKTSNCGVGAPYTFNYVGCFVDNKNSIRTLPTQLSSTMTGYQTCFNQAQALGLRYVGFQWWNGPSSGVGTCFAGNSLTQAQSQGVATNCIQVTTTDGSIMSSDSAGSANAVYDIGNFQNVFGVTSTTSGVWSLAMSSTSCAFPSGLTWALQLISNKVTSGSGTASVSKTYTTAGKFTCYCYCLQYLDPFFTLLSLFLVTTNLYFSRWCIVQSIVLDCILHRFQYTNIIYRYSFVRHQHRHHL